MGILFVLTGFAVLAFGQSNPTVTKQKPSDQVIYAAFFRHVTRLESYGDQLDAAGKSSAAMRSRIQRSAGLSNQEIATVKKIAADCQTAIAASDAAAKSLVQSSRSQISASGVPSAALAQQLAALQTQKDQMVLDHVQQITSALGPPRAKDLDRWIRGTSTVRVVSMKVPSRSK